MAAAKLKTARNQRSVAAFLDSVKDPQRRADSRALVALMESASGEKARMWGASIVGFGSYHYVYESGREGDWMLTGFSPRKQNMTVYVMSGFGPFAEALAELGKCKTSVCCLYFKRLSDLHLPTLRKMVKQSVALTKKRQAAVRRKPARA
jgi:hypothetical protein